MYYNKQQTRKKIWYCLEGCILLLAPHAHTTGSTRGMGSIANAYLWMPPYIEREKAGYHHYRTDFKSINARQALAHEGDGGRGAAQHLHGCMSLDILGRVGREAAILAQDIKHPRPHALPCEAFVPRDHGGKGDDQGRGQKTSRRRVVSMRGRERERRDANTRITSSQGTREGGVKKQGAPSSLLCILNHHQTWRKRGRCPDGIAFSLYLSSSMPAENAEGTGSGC